MIQTQIPVRVLNFGKQNAKLHPYENLYTFSLVAGHSCPFAKDCLSKVNKKTGKLEDGKHTKFRCFSASTESTFPIVFKSRLQNFDIVKTCKTVEELTELLSNNLPRKADIVRLHVSGDFFSQMYFDAWLNVAEQNPDILFYAYTKALPFWINRLDEIPENFNLTASYGGTRDDLIFKHNLKFAKVVYSPEEAQALNLEIDHDDSHAMKGTESFALLIHGIQPKGSVASKALSTMRSQGVNFSYSRA